MSRELASSMAIIDDDIFDKMMENYTNGKIENMFKFIFTDKISQEKLMNLFLKRKHDSKNNMDFISEKIKENELDINNITSDYEFVDFLSLYKEMLNESINDSVDLKQKIVKRI